MGDSKHPDSLPVLGASPRGSPVERPQRFPASAHKRPDSYMDQDLKKIKKLTAFMKKEGLISLKSGDIELELSVATAFHVEQADLPPESPATPEKPQYTDEELLMWSAPGYVPGEVN